MPLPDGWIGTEDHHHTELGPVTVEVWRLYHPDGGATWGWRVLHQRHQLFVHQEPGVETPKQARMDGVSAIRTFARQIIRDQLRSDLHMTQALEGAVDGLCTGLGSLPKSSRLVPAYSLDEGAAPAIRWGLGIAFEALKKKAAAEMALWNSLPHTQAEKDVLAERTKQRDRWPVEHDAEHHSPSGELVQASVELAYMGTRGEPAVNPRAPDWVRYIQQKHLKDRRKQLVIAASLLLAEIEVWDLQHQPETHRWGKLLDQFSSEVGPYHLLDEKDGKLVPRCWAGAAFQGAAPTWGTSGPHTQYPAEVCVPRCQACLALDQGPDGEVLRETMRWIEGSRPQPGELAPSAMPPAAFENEADPPVGFGPAGEE